MKKLACLGCMVVVAALSMGNPVVPQEATAGTGEKGNAPDNERLRLLYEADQGARTGGKIDWAIVSREDKERRAEVLAIMSGNGLRTSADYFHAAMVFQHGETADEIRTAYGLAWLASVLDPGNKDALWLSAAAWDRVMMREDMPQWYGTQFWKPSKDAPWELYKIDESAVTDEDRIRMGVPTLAETRKKAEAMNR